MTSPTVTTEQEALQQVTAVVVTFNSAHCIAELAPSLASWPHVVVVDNGSHDGTPEAVSQLLPRATLIALPQNVGFGAANNRALAGVQTPYALLLNPDCLIQDRDVLGLVQTAQQWPQTAIVVPQLVTPQGRPQLNYGWLRRAWPSQGPGAEGPACIGNACGAVMLLRLDALPGTDWFDTRFFLYYEDEDLCLRLYQARLAIVIDPAVRVAHINRGSVRGRRPLQVEYLRGHHHAQSKVLFTAKHEGPAAAARHRRRALAQAGLMLLLRMLAPSPRLMARLWGRIHGLWLAPTRY